MYVGKTLFAQVMEFVPWTSFARIVHRYGGNAGVRTLSCAEQFRAMAFAQLTWRESLRDIEVILRASFSIQLSDMGGWPSIEENAHSDKLAAVWPETAPESKRPFTYDAPPHNVFVAGHECFIGCEGRPHTDECLPHHYSQVIESVYVEDQLARAAEMARCVGIEGGLESAPYILDIDLDVFHTVASIEPKDASTFHRLIRGALAITIATEAECVDELWHEDEEAKLAAADLLSRLLGHVEQVLS